MNLKTDFTELECEYFRKVCNFTLEELEVFDMRVKSHLLVEIQDKLNLSESTVTRRIRGIKKKIEKVCYGFLTEN